MVNVNKLKAKLVENGMTVEDLSNSTGLTKATIYRRFKNPNEITIEEVDRIANTLAMNASEAVAIFFTQYVS